LPEAGEAVDLDDLIRRVDPDRWLASRFISDPVRRAEVVALYAFDHELERARRVTSQTLLAEMRLVWWREALDEIFAETPVRRHPTAEALAAAARRRSLPRDLMEAMIDGHIEALGEGVLSETAATRWADAVQGSIAEAAACVLDPSIQPTAARPAGRAWGLALLVRFGRVRLETVADALVESLAEARTAARRLSVAALPAALPARLARYDLAGRSPGPLAKRLALVAASLTGRI
jgi:15-cis-phytoene synthase